MIAGSPISAEERQAVADWIASQNLTASSVGRGVIASQFGITDRRARTILDQLRWSAATPTPSSSEQVILANASVDELMGVYRSWVGWSEAVDSDPPTEADGEEKIVICGDPHAPFQSKDAIRRMVDAEAKDADRLVINGDLTDLQNWSRHDKFGQKFTPRDEIAEAQALLNFFSESFPRVDIVGGNHDARWIKYMVARNVEAGVLEAFRLLCPHFDSPLHLLAKDLPNVSLVPRQKIGHAEFGFFHQIGDLITTHAEVYSKIPNRAVGNVIHWLKSYAEPQMLVKPFKVVVQNHTHQFGLTWNDFGVYGIENGCMCDVGDYCSNPQLRGAPRPWLKGYTVAHQVNGVTDISRLRVIPLGI
jgi:hypothetical protein